MILRAHRLCVRIGPHEVCHDLDLDLAPGSRLAILGRNGAGKSTLLTTLAGLRAPESGDLHLAGKPYAAHGPRASARLRGWLGQERGDPFASTVQEAVLTGRHPHLDRWAWESAADLAIARDALAATGLAGFEPRQMHTLSGGERQRVAIAALLAQTPLLTLLDEPLAHLDLNHQIATLDLFARCAHEQGSAVVMVLHEPNFALRYCDQTLLLFGNGRHLIGPTAEVLDTTTLTRLYDHPMRRIGDFFVPE